jgi:hypothetical protein
VFVYSLYIPCVPYKPCNTITALMLPALMIDHRTRTGMVLQGVRVLAPVLVPCFWQVSVQSVGLQSQTCASGHRLWHAMLV